MEGQGDQGGPGSRTSVMLCRNPNSRGSRWDWDQFLAQRMLLITLCSVCARGPGLGIKTSQKVSQTYHGPGQGLCMDGREEGAPSGNLGTSENLRSQESR